jgi:hypothetical protein
MKKTNSFFPSRLVKGVLPGVCVLFIQLAGYAQNSFPSNGSVGIGTGTLPANTEQAIQFLHSSFGAGYGSKIHAVDEGNGATSLRMAVRGNSTSWVNALYIRAADANGGNNGFVGVGTITPQARLHVDGDIKLSGNLAWGKGALTLDQNGSIELGGNNGVAGGGTPFLDFHYNTLAQDYNTRIINDADGRLSIVANTLYADGNVGIGTTDTKGYKLGVNGSAIATSMTVKSNANWPDFVFTETYGLRSLAEVESYIQANSHLPEVPSAAQVAKDGINLGEMDATLLKKIEELTLYLIEQNKQLQEQNKQLQELKKGNEALQKEVQTLKK